MYVVSEFNMVKLFFISKTRNFPGYVQQWSDWNLGRDSQKVLSKKLS